MLIGAARYDHLAAIPAAAANVIDLADTLVGPGGALTGDQCETVIDPGSATEVGTVVGRAARAATEVLLVYYAGHGLLDSKGRLYLTVPGTDPDDLRWTTVAFETLREEILDSPARAKVLILDCCFAGRAFEAMADLPGLIAGQTDLRGTYTIASSSANEPSFAPAGDRNTAFTAALLAAAAATPGGTLDQLYQETDRHLHRDGHPRPRRRTTDAAGELRLFGQPGDEYLYRRAADAGNADAMNSLGWLLEERGELREAEDWYRKAAAAGDARTMNKLGWLLERRGELREAEDWYRKAAAAGNAYAMNNLGGLLEQRGDLAEAETWFRRGADVGNKSTMASLGYLLQRRGDLAEAETWFRRGAGAGNMAAMGALGYLCEERGDLAEAETWYRHAEAAGSLAAMNSLGNLFMRRGDLAEAETWYRRGADDGDPDAMTNLGNLLEAHGDLAEAESWYRRAAGPER
ncbi:caspase, EACC1-associated type [Nocardia sp. BMG111209]|uniref:caspase, EACC1-associated type n=1 Tax=Nocardia sp. BMG111209 TaxID=1160137 RepID=UPI00036E77C2|nr:tetratricopeptide repeat protein [Nocardia sp. BMG111209]